MFHDVMHKRGVCWRKMSVCLSVRQSRSGLYQNGCRNSL